LSQSLQSKGTLEQPYVSKKLDRITAHATSLTRYEKWASYRRNLIEIQHMQQVSPWGERQTEISSVCIQYS
jgi:LmbE family N-acetylglucosaminyl deacetylase